jgi:hypothetical protein
MPRKRREKPDTGNSVTLGGQSDRQTPGQAVGGREPSCRLVEDTAADFGENIGGMLCPKIRAMLAKPSGSPPIIDAQPTAQAWNQSPV